MGISAEKMEIRRFVWERLEREGVGLFPKPLEHRIPNFLGAEGAAELLVQLNEFKRAKVVKVNPDAPQRPLRQRVLRSGKALLMPTPRLRGGFLYLEPQLIPKGRLMEASSIRGAFRLGRAVSLRELPTIDLIVMGSVAVSPLGARLGKGEGYAELEYGVLRELGCIDDSTPIATTVHDLQVVDTIPFEEHDVPLDIIATPTKILRPPGTLRKPRGILWDKLDEGRLEAMPILKEVKSWVKG